MQLLHGWREIAYTFKVKQTTAKNWQGMGAPVLCLEEKSIAEAGELWAWLKVAYGQGQMSRSKEEAKGPALLTWGSAAQIKKAMREEGIVSTRKNWCVNRPNTFPNILCTSFFRLPKRAFFRCVLGMVLEKEERVYGVFP